MDRRNWKKDGFLCDGWRSRTAGTNRCDRTNRRDWSGRGPRVNGCHRLDGDGWRTGHSRCSGNRRHTRRPSLPFHDFQSHPGRQRQRGWRSDDRRVPVTRVLESYSDFEERRCPLTTLNRRIRIFATLHRTSNSFLSRWRGMLIFSFLVTSFSAFAQIGPARRLRSGAAGVYVAFL